MVTARSGRRTSFTYRRTLTTGGRSRSLRWEGDGRRGFAELEPVDELPPGLPQLAN